MGRVVVRTATRGDVAAVLGVWGQARTPFASTPDTTEAVALLLERSPDGLLVAEVDGAVVGTLVAGWDGWRGNLYRLAVLPDQRRHGVATALVEEALQRLRGHGARRVTALVATDDDVAQELWRAVGFELDDHASRFVLQLAP